VIEGDLNYAGDAKLEKILRNLCRIEKKIQLIAIIIFECIIVFK
jgi:hypothetical protein